MPRNPGLWDGIPLGFRISVGIQVSHWGVEKWHFLTLSIHKVLVIGNPSSISDWGSRTTFLSHQCVPTVSVGFNPSHSLIRHQSRGVLISKDLACVGLASNPVRIVKNEKSFVGQKIFIAKLRPAAQDGHACDLPQASTSTKSKLYEKVVLNPPPP